MTESDLASVLEELSGRPFTKELAHWVHTTSDLPVKSLLQRQGVNVLEEPAQLAQGLGLRVAQSSGIQIKTVLRGSAAERAGFAAGDEWLGLSVGSGKSASHWRLTQLDDLALYAGTALKVGALVARDKRLINLSLTLPKSVTSWRLAVRDSKLVGQWLN
jgi:predicted metalloprotease with PDZ domain